MSVVQHRPSEILDIATRMSKDYEGTSPRKLLSDTIYAEYYHSWSASDSDFAKHPDAKRLVREYGEYVAKTVPSLLTGAYVYHVHQDMTDVITWAAAGLDETVTYSPEQLPTPVGFAYFDSPILLADVRGNNLHIHGLLWGPTQSIDGDPVTAIYSFSDAYRASESPETIEALADASMTAEDLIKLGGRLQMQHMSYLSPGDEAGPALLEPPEGAMLSEEWIPQEYANIDRVFIAFIKLLNQTLVKTAKPQIERHAAKRAKRQGLPQEVTTVTLRRVEYKHPDGETPDEPTPTEWSRRWIVRGHWRWQPCGPAHVLAEEDGHGGHHAHIYINPHVKGPEDKPLVVTERVYDVSR